MTSWFLKPLLSNSTCYNRYVAAAGGELIAAFKELGDPALLGVRLVPRLASSHVEGLKVGPEAKGVSRARNSAAAAEAVRDAALLRGPLLVVAARGVGLLSGGGASAVASALARMVGGCVQVAECS
jgi:hypothetical protein